MPAEDEGWADAFSAGGNLDAHFATEDGGGGDVVTEAVRRGASWWVGYYAGGDEQANHGEAVDARAAVLMGRCTKHASRRVKAGVSETRVEGAHVFSANIFLGQFSDASFSRSLSSEKPILE